MGRFSRRRRHRQINHPLHGGRRERWLAGFARFIARQACNAFRHEPRLPPPYTGLALPDRRMISAVPQPSAVARMILARQTCFCGALRSLTIESGLNSPVTK